MAYNNIAFTVSSSYDSIVGEGNSSERSVLYLMDEVALVFMCVTGHDISA